MNAIRLLAFTTLILIGILALAYGGVSYTRHRDEARLGSLVLSVKKQETVTIPVWLGAGTLLAGVVLLLIRR